MNVPELALIIAAGLSLIAIAPLVLIIYLLVRSHKELIGEFTSLKEKTADEEKLVREAQLTAQKTIEASAKKAQEIISSAQIFKNEVEASFKQNLTKASQDQSAAYREATQIVLQESIKEVKTLSNTIIKQTSSSFNQVLLEEKAQIKKQLAEYKKAKIVDIDEKIESALSAAALKIIGKSISRQEHEELVVNSLEEALKENGL